MPEVDQLGRPLHDLRVSVTDRCNFRCPYCMPAEVYGARYAFLPKPELLSFEEIERLARLFVELGVEKLRITGGEPLLRADLPGLVRRLAAIPGLRDLTLTTNGVLLERQAGALADAGLRRISVSLDSHDESVFRRMSGGRAGPGPVLAGIEAARAGGPRADQGELRRAARRERRGHRRSGALVQGHRHRPALHRVHGRGDAQRLESLAGRHGAGRSSSGSMPSSRSSPWRAATPARWRAGIAIATAAARSG